MSFAESLAQGRAALLAGDAAAAAAIVERCLLDDPAAADGWFLLGAARHRLQDLRAAQAAFQKAACLDPRHLQSRYALAAVCLQLADAEQAMAVAREAVVLAPDEPNAWFSLAVAQEAGGGSDAALDSYAEVLSRNPVHADALRNRALLLHALGRFDEAAVGFRRLTEMQPELVDTWIALGESLLAIEDCAAAATAFEQAARRRPGHVPLLLRRAFALAQGECFAEAQHLFDQAALIDPAQVDAYRRSIFGAAPSLVPSLLDARVLFLLRHFDAIERCDWRGRGRFVKRFHELVNEVRDAPLSELALGFRAMASGLDPAVQSRFAGQLADAVRRKADAVSEGRSRTEMRERAARADGRLRIAYLSGDFRRHACAYLMCRLPELHDRARFEVFLYATGPDDGSEIRQRIAAGADRFYDAAADGDVSLAQRIADDDIDILVDLAGYTDYARPVVLALRPAKLQLTYLGYLQTSGAPWIDYAIADRHVLPPELRQHWREHVAFLPHTLFICDDAPMPAKPSETRAAAGLPPEAFVFACLNASWKIDPETFACWMDILTRVPQAVLWLYASSEQAEANLRRSAIAAGIAGERLFFARRVPHAAHLARFVHADVFLDTFICNAHTTAIEALAAGVPVVTLPGPTPVARVAAGLLRAHGLGELVAGSREDYVRIACRLAGDSALLATMKSRAAGRAGSRLFCTERRVREIELAFETMWTRYRAGLPAADFDVPDLRLPEHERSWKA